METPTQSINAIQSPAWDDMERMAKYTADSKLFGITSPAQAMCLFAICTSEGINYISALRRYHIIEGRPSMRADAMLAEFLKAGGGVIWHIRTDQMVAATWFADTKKIDDAARARGAKRFELLWLLPFEEDPSKSSKIMHELAGIARDGEETILRTYADCEEKGLTLGKGGETKTNWATSPRQMLTARNLTEGIRLVLPGLIAGIAEEGEARDIASAEREERSRALAAALGPQAAAKATAAETVADLRERAMSTDNPEERRQLLGAASDLANADEIPGLAQDAPAQQCEVLPANAPVPPVASVPPQEEPWPADWREYKLRLVKASAYKGKKLGSLTPAEIHVLHEKRALPHMDSQDEDLRIEAAYIKKAFSELPKAEEGAK